MASVVVPVVRRRRAAALKKKNSDPVHILAHEQQMQNAFSVQDFISASLDDHLVDTVRNEPSEEESEKMRTDHVHGVLKTEDDIAEDIVYTEAVVSEVRRKVIHFEETKGNYCELFTFMLVMLLYLTILLMQRDPYTAWTMESTAKNAIFQSGDEGILAESETIDDAPAFYSWLNEIVVNKMFMDPNCGNGRCEDPQEFKAFRTARTGDAEIGCMADCGSPHRHEPLWPQAR
jgi:hypothetical protein